MAKVKVWNDNTYVYQDKFKGQEIVIQPKDFILMESDEAIQFKSAFPGFGLKRKASGQQDPSTFKMIRIEVIDEKQLQAEQEARAKQALKTCQLCSFEAQSDIELDRHVTEAHLDSMIDKEEAQKATSRRGKSKGAQAVTA